MHAHESQNKRKRNASDPDDDEEVDNDNGMRTHISRHVPRIILLNYFPSLNAHQITRTKVKCYGNLSLEDFF